MQWKKADEIPALTRNDYGWPMSNVVLAYTRGERYCVVYCQKMEDEIEWIESCSESWNITDYITHWRPLPIPPERGE